MKINDLSFIFFDTSFYIICIIIILLILLSAFFSGSETALTGASRAKLRGLMDKGSKGAQNALELTENNEKLIGALLLGNNFVNILAASLATSLLTRYFEETGVLLATVIMTFLILIFAEVMPKTYAITNSEKAATKVAKIVKIIVILFTPLVATLRRIVRVILWTFGIKIDPNQQILAREEIAGAIALHHSEGAVKKDEKDILLGALDLSDRTVEEIMLHRSKIEMIDIKNSNKKILSQCLNSPYTRIPVFNENPENVIGVIHAKDLLRAVDRLIQGKNGGLKNLDNLDLLEISMKPYFVPETTTLNEQMRQFLKRKSHFALVVDEYGALQGLITLEDILEEIVGQIADEHDVPHEQLKFTTDGSIIMNGDMTIRDLNRATDWHLPDVEANTVAGLIMHESQTIPKIGQIFIFEGYKYEVMNKERNKLTKIKIKKIKEKND